MLLLENAQLSQASRIEATLCRHDRYGIFKLSKP